MINLFSHLKTYRVGSRQMLYTTNSSKSSIGKNADDYGDSFARDVSVKELETVSRNQKSQSLI